MKYLTAAIPVFFILLLLVNACTGAKPASLRPDVTTNHDLVIKYGDKEVHLDQGEKIKKPCPKCEFLLWGVKEGSITYEFCISCYYKNKTEEWGLPDTSDKTYTIPSAHIWNGSSWDDATISGTLTTSAESLTIGSLTDTTIEFEGNTPEDKTLTFSDVINNESVIMEDGYTVGKVLVENGSPKYVGKDITNFLIHNFFVVKDGILVLK